MCHPAASRRVAATTCALLFTTASCFLSTQRWEFFIGDTPQPEEQQAAEVEGDDGPQRPRPPIAQLQAAEHDALSGESFHGYLRLKLG